jgi:hypothetical protein
MGVAAMNTLIEIMPGKGLARQKSKDGLALINHTLADISTIMAVSDRCATQMTQAPNSCSYLGAADEMDARFLHRAKIVVQGYLCQYVSASSAYRQFLGIVMPSRAAEIPQPAAVKMLSVLYGALSKKKADDENAAMLMMACADMFGSMNDIIGASTHMWQPINRHPIVLALTIKRMLAREKWAPAPSELREEMILVRSRIGASAGRIEQWLSWIEKADVMVFTFDRAAWDGVYASLDTGTVVAMRDSCAISEDEDSPRLQALDDLAKAKLAAEAEPTRQAACAAKPGGKRTRKLTGATRHQ